MGVCGVKSLLAFSLVFIFLNCSVNVSSFPQWVWNPDANNLPNNIASGSGNNVIFASQSPSPGTSTKDIAPIKIVDTQARLFPSVVNAISNVLNRPGGSGSGGSSSSSSCTSGSGCSSVACSPSNQGPCVGAAISETAIIQGIAAGSAVAQNPSVGGVLANIVSSIFGGGATTLPANTDSKEPGNGGGGGGGSSGTGSCKCSDQCFLPSQPAGTCDGGKVNCCDQTRGVRFTDEVDKQQATRQVTRSEIRRALLKNIVRGSGSIIDDTIDLLVHPFLTKEDQLKVATRVLPVDE